MMATLGEFLSPQAGQDRRKWLNESLGQFIPPELRGWVGAGAELNPVTNMERASIGAKRVADPSLSGWERMAAAGDTAVNMGAVLAPVAGAKMAGTAGVDGANAIVEALTAASPMRGAVQDFAADEFGGVGFRAFHGSPHDFDRFSLDKIGTGEGAQAYGHGLYFADSEDVARSYRDALAPGMGDGALRAIGISDSDLRTMRQFTQSSVDPDIALRDWLGWTGKRETPELRAAFMQEWNGRNPGRMYEVQINANPNDFLDWDKPLSEQPFSVRDALQRGTFNATVNMSSGPERLFADNARGPDFLSVAKYPEAVDELRRQGLPGIKYLDQGSRGGGGDGSRNYVVFDDKLIEILRKYGLAGAVPMGALLGQSQDPMGSYLEAQ